MEGATTGNPMDVNLGGYYASFKSLPHGTVYHEGGRADWNVSTKEYFGVDRRSEIKSMFQPEFKAFLTTSGGAGTAGYAMIPIYVDPRVVDRTRKYTPLVEIMPRVTNLGVTADYNVITAKGGAMTLSEDSALAETDTTYDRQSTAIKYLYAVARS